MSTLLLGTLAFTPIFMVGVLLVGFRLQARWAMPAGLVLTLLLTLLVWQIDAVQVAAAGLRGCVIAVELLFIVFGAC